MICRNCGTEIADKAIVCYRCGTATTDPVRQPAAVRPRRGRLLPTVAMVLLILLGLYLGEAGRTAAAQGEPMEIAAAVCILAAMVLLVARIRRRR
jgi:hypothetical protein